MLDTTEYQAIEKKCDGCDSCNSWMGATPTQLSQPSQLSHIFYNILSLNILN